MVACTYLSVYVECFVVLLSCRGESEPRRIGFSPEGCLCYDTRGNVKCCDQPDRPRGTPVELCPYSLSVPLWPVMG